MEFGPSAKLHSNPFSLGLSLSLSPLLCTKLTRVQSVTSMYTEQKNRIPRSPTLCCCCRFIVHFHVVGRSSLYLFTKSIRLKSISHTNGKITLVRNTTITTTIIDQYTQDSGRSNERTKANDEDRPTDQMDGRCKSYTTASSSASSASSSMVVGRRLLMLGHVRHIEGERTNDRPTVIQDKGTDQ